MQNSQISYSTTDNYDPETLLDMLSQLTLMKGKEYDNETIQYIPKKTESETENDYIMIIDLNQKWLVQAIEKSFCLGNKDQQIHLLRIVNSLDDEFRKPLIEKLKQIVKNKSFTNFLSKSDRNNSKERDL
jgi:hypothetical protein